MQEKDQIGQTVRKYLVLNLMPTFIPTKLGQNVTKSILW